MMSTKKLVCFGLLSSCLAAPALYAADNCSGYYGAEGASGETVELSKGNKATFWTSHETVSSGNSAYNGLGGCGGYTIVSPDGKGWVAGACTVVAANGDTWSYTFMEELGTGRGTWKAGNGTGQFAKASNNSGWYEHTTQAGKLDTGKWGGTCAQ
jgi:hypothetical protein